MAQGFEGLGTRFSDLVGRKGIGPDWAARTKEFRCLMAKVLSGGVSNLALRSPGEVRSCSFELVVKIAM